MKTIFLIIVMGFSLLSCEKENKSSEGDPKIYDLNFELLRSDGTVYEDDNLKISNEQELFNGQLHPIGNGELFWFDLGKLTIQSQNGDSILFGISCGENCNDYLPLPFASGAEGVDVNGPVPFEKDKYWLLRYANEDVDTLRVHDVQSINPYNRTFTFYVNEQQVEATNFIYQEYAITIQK
ncbi:hypothetical protein [Aequorivita lipolytica]|uniref:Lipoprotein n=1 Tax=Aequorivita lipolytica TaxID=153267 RepID=A0A5C6YRN2_9FLAO|nr:hypothetical protein [Aequorivita lipolytica]TXD70169.1 hypothetical protein ESV24_03085 [Aequorivita lipolytica]SRX50586.1 hypothetical protein AEQU2_01060 [Aequorivita lipolytica]